MVGFGQVGFPTIGLDTVGWIVISIIGLKSVYNVGHFAYTTFLGRLLGYGIKIKNCGPWAVVTGATDGIGKAFAHALAKEGLNVVLVSRTPEKLKAVAREIRSATNESIDIMTIAVDYTESQSIYSILEAQLKELEIGILVNNVGITVGSINRYADIKEKKKIRDLINCNIMSMARMCHLVLPQMIDRRSGVIINVGSQLGIMPSPMETLYGASKAFVDKFSRDLAIEAKAFGVTIQVLHPAFVLSKIQYMFKKKTILVPDPDAYVAASLRTLGLESRTAGFWSHKIQLYFEELASFFAPGIVGEIVMCIINEHHRKSVLKNK